MILDKELEFFDKKEIKAAAVTSEAVELGKTVSANPCLIVVTANGLTAASGEGVTAGTALTVAVETADDKSMTGAKTLATFTRNAGEGIILQTHIPLDVKQFVRLKVTPTGSFASGTVCAYAVYGPQLDL